MTSPKFRAGRVGLAFVNGLGDQVVEGVPGCFYASVIRAPSREKTGSTAGRLDTNRQY